MTLNLGVTTALSPSDPLTSPDDTSQNFVDISTSTVFFQGARGVPENLVFSSQDSIRFHVHLSIFSGAAECAFHPILSAPLSDPRYQTTRVHVPETSEILNIIFHAIYNMSCLKHSPSFDAIATAIGRMPVYGINPKDYIAPSKPLHELLIHSMPHHPLEVYAIAAHYDVYDIAEAASAHLLSYPLDSISDEIARQMGPVYLKRLLCLHTNRLNALKSIVMIPPTFHAPLESCAHKEQKKLSRMWVLAAAHLVWDAQPSLSIHNLEAAFRSLQDQLSCPECCEIFSGRVREAAQGWSGVKATI